MERTTVHTYIYNYVEAYAYDFSILAKLQFKTVE